MAPPRSNRSRRLVAATLGSTALAALLPLAAAAPALVFDLIERHGIRCDARRNGTLRAALRSRHAARVRVSAEQLARRGAPIELLEGASLAPRGRRATGSRCWIVAAGI